MSSAADGTIQSLRQPEGRNPPVSYLHGHRLRGKREKSLSDLPSKIVRLQIGLKEHSFSRTLAQTLKYYKESGWVPTSCCRAGRALPVKYVPRRPLHHRLDARSLGGTPRLNGLRRIRSGFAGFLRAPGAVSIYFILCSNDSPGSPHCTDPPLLSELSV